MLSILMLVRLSLESFDSGTAYKLWLRDMDLLTV